MERACQAYISSVLLWKGGPPLTAMSGGILEQGGRYEVRGDWSGVRGDQPYSCTVLEEHEGLTAVKVEKH